MDQADLPYTAEGIVPDILFNSHGIPSRMTMGQMWEQLIAKLTALLGDASRWLGNPFTHANELRRACDRLHSAGYPRFGREPMYSGITGERLDGDVFLGIVYYRPGGASGKAVPPGTQRLRHMVQDKFHARALGPVNQLVRQPTEGRARHGGLRIGEMERDCRPGVAGRAGAPAGSSPTG
jgi:DNA-directed RNA polymerase beta subunit